MDLTDSSLDILTLLKAQFLDIVARRQESCGVFFFVCLFYRHISIPMVYIGGDAFFVVIFTAAGLHHSHSNTGSKLCLQPTPQLTATIDPSPTMQGQGLNSQPHDSQSDSFPLCHNGNSKKGCLYTKEGAFLQTMRMEIIQGAQGKVYYNHKA